MKKMQTHRVLALTLGATALVTIVLLRGMLPELQRYLKIRRM